MESFKENNKLTEEVNVENANFIGNAYGYDVFDISTWAAAQTFKVEDTEDRVGDVWLRSENNFTSRIANRGNHFYIFVREGTYGTYGAVITGIGEATLHILNHNGVDAGTIKINMLFEDSTADGNISKFRSSDPFPFFLIPNFECLENCVNGLCYNDSNITTNYKGFINANNAPIAELEIPENIDTIRAQAFSGVTWINTIVINKNTLHVICNGAFDGFDGVVACRESGDDYPAGWSEAYKERITFDYQISPEELEARNQGKVDNVITLINNIGDVELTDDCAAKLRTAWEALQKLRDLANRVPEDIRNIYDQSVARYERLKAEKEEEDRRREEERRRTLLKYRVNGNKVTIYGSRIIGDEKLEIPDQIEGHPVTAIAPFAFYGRNDLKIISLPKTITEFGRGSFVDCYNRLRIIIRGTYYNDFWKHANIGSSGIQNYDILFD